jgi:ABC-type branched-subunit amino acid transport system ATPase component
MSSTAEVRPILEVRGVERSFGGVRALQGMDLTLARGETSALIGPNGSGKSTLVNVITRMVDADRGTVFVDGVDVTHVRRDLIARHGVSRTFQHIRLIPELTLRENAAAGAVFRDLARPGGELRSWATSFRGARSALAAADEALDLMEVPRAARERTPRAAPFALQRQTEMARALAGRPKVVLLDEPGAGMNPAEVAVLLRLLGAIRGEGIAVLLIDHNMDFVMRAAGRIAVLNRGVRIAFGDADEVRRDPAVIEAYLGSQRGQQVADDVDGEAGRPS